MADIRDVMPELEAKGTEKTRAIYLRHGAPAGERTLGVSIADLKAIAKKLKGQQALACELYATGVFEAMYLAGLVAKGSLLSRTDLQRWAESAEGMPMVSEYTVPWMAVESAEPRAVAVEWIASEQEHVAAAGWRTYAGIVMTTHDAALDLPEVKALLDSVATRMMAAPNRVKLGMNGFVISVGAYVAPLHAQALAVAEELGTVAVTMGDTACKVPNAAEAIAKAGRGSATAAKKKTVRC